MSGNEAKKIALACKNCSHHGGKDEDDEVEEETRGVVEHPVRVVADLVEHRPDDEADEDVGSQTCVQEYLQIRRAR